MAAAFFNEMVNPTAARAVPASMERVEEVPPEVLLAMRESGVEIAAMRPQPLTSELAASADLVITMGPDAQALPVEGVRRDDWPLADPQDQPIGRIRMIRDEIRILVWKLIAREAWFHPLPESRSS